MSQKFSFSQIEKDLAKKLYDDIRAALLRYEEMTKTAHITYYASFPTATWVLLKMLNNMRRLAHRTDALQQCDKLIKQMLSKDIPS